MNRISENLQIEVLRLRLSGKSIPEISRETGVAKTTVQRYVRGVKIPAELLKNLKEKQGGARERAMGLRANALERASALLGNLSERDYAMLLIGLYWGEGTKRDLSIINSDASLLQTVMLCLRMSRIATDRISISLRVHNDIRIPEAKAFWVRTLRVPEERIEMVEVIEGKKKGKLPYGMCRIRVRSGIRERLLIQSAIMLIGKEASEGVLSP